MTDQKDDPANLTRREIQIIQLIAHGSSTKVIADVLKITGRTVEKHVDNARIKLNAKNRTHVVALTVHKGIITMDDDFTRADEDEEKAGQED